MATLPSLFLSHGAPLLATESHPVTRFWRDWAARIDRPQTILVVSAHWEASGLRIASAARPTTIHDFYGFPEPLYSLRYKAPGAPEWARHLSEHLAHDGFTSELDPERGWDHGVWVPLLHMYPAADIPVLALSLPRGAGPQRLFALGQALKPLRAEGLLIMGSGGATHNLRALGATGPEGGPPRWARAFQDWLHEALVDRRLSDLWDYRNKAPYAAQNHPSEEHLLPLFVALGAAGEDARAHRECTGFLYGSLAMDSYSFDTSS